MYYEDHSKTKHRLQIKALNSLARQQQAQDNQAAASSEASTAIRSSRPVAAVLKAAWMKKHAMKPGLAEPASPRRPPG